MTLLALMFGMIGAAFSSEKPAFTETTAHWYAPRQTMRAAAKFVEKWTGNAELLEQELVKTGWSLPFDRGPRSRCRKRRFAALRGRAVARDAKA